MGTGQKLWKRAKQMFYANRADLLLADYRSVGSRQFFPLWHLDMDPPVVLFSLQTFVSAEKLKDKTVGWLLGYEFDQFLPVSVNGVEVSAEQFGFDMLEYGKMRYGLLGNGGHWFPGKKLDGADLDAVKATVAKHPFASVIPERLQEAHALLKGEEKKRLQE